jgi:hypothetical protein
MKKPTISITPVKGGVNVNITCPYGNAYDRTGPDGMHCSKEGCQCDIANKSAFGQFEEILSQLATPWKRTLRCPHGVAAENRCMKCD